MRSADLPPSLVFSRKWIFSFGQKVHLLFMLLDEGKVETEMKSCIFYFGFCIQTLVPPLIPTPIEKRLHFILASVYMH